MVQPWRSYPWPPGLCSSNHSPDESAEAVGFCITSVMITSPSAGGWMPPTQAPASHVPPVTVQSTVVDSQAQLGASPSLVHAPGASHFTRSLPSHSGAGSSSSVHGFGRHGSVDSVVVICPASATWKPLSDPSRSHQVQVMPPSALKRYA